MSEPMSAKDITTEEWREYQFADGRVYRIEHPRTLIVGSTTHRVVDSQGVTHCIAFPGDGVVLRWKADPPVSF